MINSTLKYYFFYKSSNDSTIQSTFCTICQSILNDIKVINSIIRAIFYFDSDLLSFVSNFMQILHYLFKSIIY